MDLSRINREIQEISEDIVKSGELVKELHALEQYSGHDKVQDFPTLSQIATERESKLVPIRSRMPKLDSILGGFNHQDLVLVTAPTGHGKTSLFRTFTHTFVDAGISCLWFSYEVQGARFYNLFGENQNLVKAFAPSRLETGNLDWLRERILEGIAKFNTRVVFIDDLNHLVTLDLFSKVENTATALGWLVKRLKDIARETDTAIFLAVHVTKLQSGETAKMSHIRDSGQIPNIADTVLVLNRIMEKEHAHSLKLERMTNRAWLSVQKNRNTGQTGNLEVIYTNGRYMEVEKSLRELNEAPIDDHQDWPV